MVAKTCNINVCGSENYYKETLVTNQTITNGSYNVEPLPINGQWSAVSMCLLISTSLEVGTTFITIQRNIQSCIYSYIYINNTTRVRRCCNGYKAAC